MFRGASINISSIHRLLGYLGPQLLSFFIGMLTSGLVIIAALYYSYSSIRSFEVYENDIGMTGQTKFEVSTTITAEITKEDSLGSRLVDINSATLTQLETLPGIGPALAQRIIDARPFTTLYSIQRVSGIGSKKYEVIKNLIGIN